MRDQDRPAVLAHQRFDADRSAFVGLDLASRFQRIHETNLWGAATSVSGLGSEDIATAKLQFDLPALLKGIGVASLLDAPCGDASWIGKAGIDVDYIGVDIVPKLVEAVRARTWPDPARARFMVADITADNMPRADAVLCRDCLVHLSFENILRAVENFRRSGATWLVTTTFSDWSTNADVEDGDWRALNFMHPPFSWPMPHLLLDEGCDEAGGGYRDKSLGVWRDGAGFQRRNQADDFVPVRADDVGLYPVAHQRFQQGILSWRLDARHAAVAKIARTRAEPKAQHLAKGQDVICRTASIGDVHVDLQAGAVVKQAIEYKRGFMCRRRDDSRMIGAMLVGDMGIK